MDDAGHERMDDAKVTVVDHGRTGPCGKAAQGFASVGIVRVVAVPESDGFMVARGDGGACRQPDRSGQRFIPALRRTDSIAADARPFLLPSVGPALFDWLESGTLPFGVDDGEARLGDAGLPTVEPANGSEIEASGDGSA